MPAFEKLTTYLEGKSPDFDELISLRNQALRAGGTADDALMIAADWSSSRENQGVFLYLTGHQRRAAAILESQAASDIGKLAGGMAALELGQASLALRFLKGAKSHYAKHASARANLALGHLDEADALITELEKDHPSSDVMLLRSDFLLRDGDIAGGIDLINNVISSHGRSTKALFSLAVAMDRIGEDARAIEIYEEIAQMRPISVQALINLGILYEDRGDFKHATRCYRAILREYPRHKRARLYMKDAEASMDMYYDEDRERREDKRMQVLRTPCSDFELSVRSRNCLTKMGIDTLGDLITRTEQELLTYKNFGETSLDEIKAILGSKGLRLGMTIDEALRASSIDEALDRAKPKHEGVLAESVDALELSVRARRCMERIAIKTIGELTENSEQALLAAPNFGATSLIEVKRKLADLGLSLKA